MSTSFCTPTCRYLAKHFSLALMEWKKAHVSCPALPHSLDPLTYNGGLQVHEDGAGHVLAGSCLVEEGVEGVVATAHGLVGGHLAIRVDAVLQAVQLPAGVAHLHSGLPHVHRDTLPLRAQSSM